MLCWNSKFVCCFWIIFYIFFKNFFFNAKVFFVNRAGVVLSRAVHAALAQLGDSEIERLFQVNCCVNWEFFFLTSENTQVNEYKARIANERATLSVLQRRVADSKHMLVSRKVAAQDPSIRKSFIVRMPKKPAKVRKERSGLSKSARAPVEEKATDDETSTDDNVAESKHSDDETDEVPTQASEPEVEQSEGEDSDDNDDAADDNDDADDDTEDKPADDDEDSEEMDRLLAEKRAKLAAIQAEEDESSDSDSLGVNA